MGKPRDIADSAAVINALDGVTATGTELNILDGITATTAELNYVDGVTSAIQTQLDNISVTSGTLTKTFAQDEVATITLSSSITTPVVSVTKEVSQTGVTNNTWDVNSTSENYTRLDSAPATTLSFTSDITNVSYDSVSLSVSAQESIPTGLTFNNDGTKLFIVGQLGDAVDEWALSTAYDLSTATYTTQFSVSSQDLQPNSVTFNSDGTRMYVCGVATNRVYEYTLTTGFDVSTASSNYTFDPSSQTTQPRGMRFNSDGTKMFVIDSIADSIFQYGLTTAYDLSTASYDSVSLDVSSQDIVPEDLVFNSGGTELFIAGNNDNAIDLYTLSTGFDLSTASHSGNASVSSQETDVKGITLNGDATKVYIIGNNGDSVYQYSIPKLFSLGSGSFASADVGKTIEANSGVFVLTSTSGAFSETTTPTSYAQVASGSWEMYAVVYNTTDGDLEISNKSDNYSIQAASYDSVSFAMSGTGFTGIAFNSDGTKLFAVERSADRVREHSLSTPYDISTASQTQFFYVGSQESNPRGLLFSPDGTKMYVSGSTSQQVHKYNLTTGYDISTASYSNSTLNTSNQDSWPSGMAWNADGTVIFVVGQTNDRVNGYSCPSAYDAAGGSHISNYTISQDTSPTDVAFNADGTKMFVSGLANDKVYEYSLSSAYTVNSSTVSYVRDFSVAAQENQPSGLIFNNNGSKMYITGEQTDDIFQYSTVDLSAPTGYHAVHTTASTDTTYWTDINSMTADEAAGDGSIFYCVSTDDRSTWKIAHNTDGIRSIVRNNSGTWQYNSNGTYASTTWTNATTNTELNALQEAMTGASASVPYDLANSTEVTFTSDPGVGGTEVFILSADGTRGYWLSSSDIVYQADLPSAFTGSGGSWGSLTNFSVTSQETTPTGLRFKSDGTKMYVVGYATDAVYQYSLSTAWDVTSASYDSVSFSVSTQSTTPGHLSFSENGSYMYISDINTKVVYQYNLSTAWDLSSASYSSNSITLSSPSGLSSVDVVDSGTKMFASFTGQIKEYSLSSAYDVSTATATSDSISSLGFSSPSIQILDSGGYMALANGSSGYLQDINVTTSYPNQMNKTQLDAVSDANHFTLANDLDLGIIFNLSSGTTVPSSDGVSINYDANVLNKGAILGTDYDFDAPAATKVRITALAANNLKVRVV